jgi:hypothetical protein
MRVVTGEPWIVLQAQCQRLSDLLNRLCHQAMELLPLDRTAEGNRLQREMLHLRLAGRALVKETSRHLRTMTVDSTSKLASGGHNGTVHGSRTVGDERQAVTGDCR